jgi:spore germination cell wall hydrolase CwlJ-like protein
LLITSLARAEKARALIGAALLGSLMGLAIGGAYIAGGLARASVAGSQAERLAQVAAKGYSEQALLDAVGAGAVAIAPDPSALAAPPAPAVDAKPARAELRREAAKPFQLAAAAQGRDLDCLTQAVYYEARGEGSAGQAAVAQVILNRVRHPAFPKTVCAVVFQGVRGVGCQFSFACDGSVRRSVERAAWRRARQIAEQALEGSVMSQVGTATHFHAARLSDPFGDGLKKVAQVGAHIFYRFSGRGGAAKAFSGEPQVSGPNPSEANEPAHPVFASFAIPGLLPSLSSMEQPAPAAAEPATKPVAQPAASAPAPAAATAAPPPPVAAPATAASTPHDAKPTPAA